MTEPSEHLPDTPLDPRDRAAALELLARQAVGGPLTLDEYAARAVAVEHTATARELAATTAEWSREAPEPSPPGPAQWLVGVLGGSEQRGRWRLGRRLRIVAVLGGVHADLGSAQVEAPVSTITVFALLGGAELNAPPGVPVQMSGFSLLGGKSDERPAGPPLRGAPLIRVRAFALLGGVAVKERSARGPGPLARLRARRGRPSTA